MRLLFLPLATLLLVNFLSPLTANSKEMVYEGYSSAIISGADSIFVELGEDETPELEKDRCQRTLVAHGMNASIGALIGFIDSAAKAGHPIDCLVVSTGAAIGAAVQHVFGSEFSQNEALRKYLLETSTDSSTYHGLLSQVEVSEIEVNYRMFTDIYTDIQEIAEYAAGQHEAPGGPRAPNLHDLALKQGGTLPSVRVRNSVHETSPLNVPFNPLAKIRVVMVGSHLDYGRTTTGHRGPSVYYKRDATGKVIDETFQFPVDDPDYKPVSEVYFTDERTAKLLEGYKSQINRLFPRAMVAERTIVLTHIPVGQAALIAASDPFLMKPQKLKDPNGREYQGYFFGGGVNLNPWEVARHITKRNGGELIMSFPGGRSPGESEALTATFGHRQEERMIHSVTALLSLDEVKYKAVGGPDFWLNLTSPNSHYYNGGENALGFHVIVNEACFVGGLFLDIVSLGNCDDGKLTDLTKISGEEHKRRMLAHMNASEYLMQEALANGLRYDGRFIGHIAEDFVSEADEAASFFLGSEFDWVTYGNAPSIVGERAESEEESALKRERAKSYLRVHGYLK